MNHIPHLTNPLIGLARRSFCTHLDATSKMLNDSEAKMKTQHLATNSWKYQHFVTQSCVCSVHKLQIIWTRKMHSNKSDIGSDSPVVWWAERGSRSSEPLYAFSSAAIPRRTTCSIRWNVTWCCIKLIQLLEGIFDPQLCHKTATSPQRMGYSTLLKIFRSKFIISKPFTKWLGLWQPLKNPKKLLKTRSCLFSMRCLLVMSSYALQLL